MMSYQTASIEVLWRRDCLRFFRQPTRLVGALGQPIIFWGIIGSGFAETFRMPGMVMDYPSFFFGGVLMMVIVFSSIFASVSLIEDRHQGFLRSVLVAPGSRFAMVLGKCAGSATVALTQVLLLMALAPLAGFSYAQIDWPLLLLSASLATVALSAIGFAVAWWLDNVQAYHAVQMTLLVPLWVISGAMFPVPSEGVMHVLGTYNPLSFAVSAIRHALAGGSAPAEAVVASVSVSVCVLMALAASSLLLAFFACRPRE